MVTDGETFARMLDRRPAQLPPGPVGVRVHRADAGEGLSARKLRPALYNLCAEGLLPRKGDISGAAPVAL